MISSEGSLPHVIYFFFVVLDLPVTDRLRAPKALAKAAGDWPGCIAFPSQD